MASAGSALLGLSDSAAHTIDPSRVPTKFHRPQDGTSIHYWDTCDMVHGVRRRVRLVVLWTMTLALAPWWSRGSLAKKAPLPIVVNTWAFTNATNVAWNVLMDSDRRDAALDAVEMVGWYISRGMSERGHGWWLQGRCPVQWLAGVGLRGGTPPNMEHQVRMVAH